MTKEVAMKTAVKFDLSRDTEAELEFEHGRLTRVLLRHWDVMQRGGAPDVVWLDSWEWKKLMSGIMSGDPTLGGVRENPYSCASV